MGLFHRKTTAPSPGAAPATDAQLREIGRLVNAGRLDEAEAIAQTTDDPNATAFAAFRYIDPTE